MLVIIVNILSCVVYKLNFIVCMYVWYSICYCFATSMFATSVSVSIGRLGPMPKDIGYYYLLNLNIVRILVFKFTIFIIN